MKPKPIHPWIRLALAAAAAGGASHPPSARAEVLVNLDFTVQAAGPLLFVPNSGLAGGGFQAVSEAGNDPTITTPALLGPPAAEFDGSDFLAHVDAQDGAYQIVDSALAGVDPQRSIEVWAFNPSTVGEETMVSWGRRGGPVGTNLSFNYGNNGQWGAVGHWDFPDLGWDPNTTSTADGTAVPPELGVWHHLVYTFGPDADTPGNSITKVYADGMLANSESIAEGTINTYADTPIAIASQLDNAVPVFTGGLRGALSLGKVRIHNAVLSDAEIAAAHDAEAVAFNRKPATVVDADADGMDDRWEARFLGGLGQSATADGDGDGLSNGAEFTAGTDPTDADTDNDGLTDGAEVNRTAGGNPAPTNPLSVDTDGDGLADNVETGTGIFNSPTNTGSNPLVVDSDGDGFEDGFEVARGSNPNLASQVPDPLKLVALDALNRPVGPLEVWPHTGLVTGDFTAETDVPSITVIDGRRGVTIDGTGDVYVGPAAPAAVTGNNSRTIEAWVYNPDLAVEETIISWGRRGGGEGSNCSFNFGSNADFGAIGHWGSPDIGWNGIAEPAEWTMLSYTYDGPTRTTRVYVNGVEANTEVLVSPLTTHAIDTTGAALRFVVGAQSEANGTRTGGLQGSMTISRIDIYDQSLPASTIERHFNELAVAFGLPPATLTDADADGLDDNGERFYFGDLAQGPAGDPDADGLTTGAELTSRTNPSRADSDDDGVADGAEVNRMVGGTPAATNPLSPDSDQDGLLDGVETGTGVFVSATNTGSNPLVADTDGDGFDDFLEVDAGTNPNNAQSFPTATFPPLAHRYGFSEGGGTAVYDSVGDGHGQVLGDGATWEPGQLLLPGGASDVAAYVDLPNGIISRVGANGGGSGRITIEGWVTVQGGGGWTRIFDFGSNAPGGAEGEITGPGETNAGGTNGLDYLVLTGYRGDETNTRRLEWAERDPADLGASILDFNHTNFNTQVHFVVTFDEATDTLRYYEDGTLIGTFTTAFALGNLNDVNNWLGRSNYTGDSNLQGRFNELRIYDELLTEPQIRVSSGNGPDVVPSLPSAAGLAITAAVYNGTTRQATLSWSSVPGRNYLVEQSDTLQTWTVVEPVAGQAGSTTWTSPVVPPEITQRFYRVRAF